MSHSLRVSESMYRLTTARSVLFIVMTVLSVMILLLSYRLAASGRDHSVNTPPVEEVSGSAHHPIILDEIVVRP